MLTNEQRRIVEDNMRLVPFAIRKMRFSITRAGLSYDDARQAGYEGLCKAITRWDPELAKLATYAAFCIRGAILNACAENSMLGAGREMMRKHPELWTAAISMQTPIGPEGDDFTLGDMLPSASNAESRAAVADIWDMFSEAEQRALAGVLNGQKRLEIAQAVGTTHQAVGQAMQRVRRKTADYLALCEA